MSDSLSDPRRTQPRAALPALDSDRTAERSHTAGTEPGGPVPIGTTAPAGYELLDELGRGGMGVVYRARQTALNREVAIKTILRADEGSATVARFWAEAEVMAAVRHPNVVQVYEFGEHAGHPFMALELLTGGSLADLLQSGAMLSRAAAALVEQIARGVAAAHDQGIVHRDLKPGNVLLTSEGAPKVTDFGLAKWRSTNLTRTQTLMGTPAYMAPEQAAGRAKFLGPQADVWALGVILYECLSGTRPFAGTTAPVLLVQIQTADPVPARTRGRGLSRDLDTIVTKCLSKEPERRYATAAELADDLARFQRREPIAARPVGRAERLVRWARRKPTAAAAYALCALAVALALVVFVVAGLWREAAGAKKIAEGATIEADTARGRVEQLLGTETGLRQELQNANVKLAGANASLQGANAKLETALSGEKAAKQQVDRANEKLARFNYGQTIRAAYQSWRDNKIAEARAQLARTRSDLRGWEYDYVHRLCHADAVTLSHSVLPTKLPGAKFPFTSASFSPDGTTVLTSDEHSVCIWRASTGTPRLHLTVDISSDTRAGYSPDGLKFFITNHAGSAQIRDARTGRPLVELKGHSGWFASAVWSQDGKRLFTRSDRLATAPSAHVWDPATGTRVAELTDLPKPSSLHTLAGAFNPDGSKVLLVFETGVGVWDAITGKPLVEFKGHKGDTVAAAAWSPDGSAVVTAGWDNTVRTWDATGKPRLVFKGHTDRAVRAVFSPDGSKVLSASADGTARLWDADTGTALAELRGHIGGLIDASFNRDGSLILTAGKDGIARIWSATGTLVNELKGHEKELTSAAFNPDGSKVLTASDDNTARIWDVWRGAARTEFAGHRGRIVAADWSRDGTMLALAALRSPVQILDAGAERKLSELDVKAVTTIRWGLGSQVLVSSANEPPTVWDANAGARVVPLLYGKGQRPNSIAWSSDGSKFLTTSLDANPRVWNARAGNLLLELERRNEDRTASNAAVFNPDETRIFAAANWGSDTVGRVWDAETGKRLVEFKGHTMPIVLARYSPDGTRIVTGGKDATARIWDAATGAQLHVLPGPKLNSVNHVMWSGDGKRLVTAGSDGVPRVWDAITGTLLVALGSYTSEITSLSWLGGESRVLTTGYDNVLRVWDVESGAEVLALPTSGILIYPPLAIVSPDGTRVLARGEKEGTAVVYDARPLNRAFIRYPVAPPPRPIAKPL